MERNIHRNLANGLLAVDIDISASHTRKRTDSMDGCGARSIDESFNDEAFKRQRKAPYETRRARSQGLIMDSNNKCFPQLITLVDKDFGDDHEEERPSFTRLNSTGSIYVDSMLNEPDVKATIQCVCTVLLAFMTTTHAADNSSTFSRCNIKGSLTVFNDANDDVDDDDDDDAPIPTISELIEFMRMVYSRGEMHVECIVTAFIYIERLLRAHDGALSFTPRNWRSIVFSTMILASKVCDDESPVNADWCYVCPDFKIQRINQLELALLAAFNFNPTVRASEYALYYFHFRSVAARTGLINAVTTAPLDVTVAQRIAATTSKMHNNPHKQIVDEPTNLRNSHLQRQRSNSERSIMAPLYRRPAASVEADVADMSPKKLPRTSIQRPFRHRHHSLR
ncbi:hypothetical protein CTAYLR_007288 [Chrysophaeum taylorii]|uniref:Cyclin-like domain-containing protein n=1 Tax=Chrysophaeum taylorii TaxID=2483200 RepID=A0AAD7UIJ2_9STRA|nr:hypothetical protein CTAYLR_007288 [Chrysophaeum taylorii]